MVTTSTLPPSRAAVAPVGLNHLVLDVRDIEESHRFWMEILGVTQGGRGPCHPEAAQSSKDALPQRRSWWRRQEPPRHRPGGGHQPAGAGD